jgi:amino acid adenylation domain-containing protein
MAEHLERLLTNITQHADRPLNQLALLSEQEKQALVAETVVQHPTGKTIIELFTEQAYKTPDHTALVFENISLTYQELNEKANRLGNYLREQYNVQPDDLVGVKLDRSELLIVAILGVLKSSAAYVTIDPEYPQERIDYMISDSNCKAVIDQEMLIAADTYNSVEPVINSTPDNLVYVIYTSGSTGQPKGVMIPDSALADYFYGIIERTNILDCKTFGFVSTISADLGNTVIFPSLLTGGALHIFSATDVMNPEKMKHAALDCLKIVPSHWKALQQEHALFAPAKCLIFGGESLTADVVDLLKNSHCEIYNHYGPSETTIGKLIKKINSRDDISLGTPIGNTQVYILDDRQQLTPMGVTGEICIAGEGLAKGYLNKAVLTAEKFIANPLGNGLMYRTGDLGRFLPDKSIAFKGRKDDQVKIRGFRIELGEIERALLGYGGIESAVVMVREEEKMVAYIVHKGNIDVEALRNYLTGKLPAYMVPGYYMQLEKMPLTSNGKIDKRSLPSPGAERSTPYVAPRNEMEEKMVAIWSDVLEVEQDKIGIRDNFFELGGHSLKAIRIVVRVHEQFDVEIDLTALFNEPTIEALVSEMENLLWLRSSNENTLITDKTIV